jgi:hypothetical protein
MYYHEKMTSEAPEDPALGLRMEEEMLTMLGEERLARLTAKVKDLRARFLARREKWKVTVFQARKILWWRGADCIIRGEIM